MGFIKLEIEACDKDVELKGIATPTGKNILRAYITAKGHLVFIYTDGTQADIGDVVGPQGEPGTILRHTKLFEPNDYGYNVGEEYSYFDVEKVYDGYFNEGDFIFDHCGYVFQLSRIEWNEYRNYVFLCLGKWLGKDGEDGKDGTTLHYVDGVPTIGEYGDISYRFTDSNTSCRRGDLLLFGGNGTLYEAKTYNNGIVYLDKVTVIAANGLKLSDFENDVGFLSYDSEVLCDDANKYFDFKIIKTAEWTENLPESVPEAKRWGLIFTLLENKTQKTGVQYFFDSEYKLYTRNCYSGVWDIWHDLLDPKDDKRTIKTYKIQSSNYVDSTYSVGFDAKTDVDGYGDIFMFIPTQSNNEGMNYIELGNIGTYPIAYRPSIGGSYDVYLPSGFFTAWRAVLLTYNGGYFEVLNYWG